MAIGEIAQLIASIATLITAVGAVVIGLRNSRKIEEVHVATNSMKDQLVASTALAANAQGNREGRAELKSEQQKETP